MARNVTRIPAGAIAMAVGTIALRVGGQTGKTVIRGKSAWRLGTAGDMLPRHPPKIRLIDRKTDDWREMQDDFEVTYDGQADALYIGLQIGWATNTVRTLPSGPDLNFDVVDGVVVGIEVLGAKSHPLGRALIPKMEGATLTGSYMRHTANNQGDGG